MVENNKGHTGKKMSNPFNFRVTAKDLLLLLERSIFVKDSTIKIKVGSVLKELSGKTAAVQFQQC